MKVSGLWVLRGNHLCVRLPALWGRKSGRDARRNVVCRNAVHRPGMSLNGPSPHRVPPPSVAEQKAFPAVAAMPVLPIPTLTGRCSGTKGAISRSRCVQHSRPRRGSGNWMKRVNMLGVKRYLVPAGGAQSLAGRSTLAIRYTIAPLASRMLWPLAMRKIFGPADVPKKFARFPKEMAVRPSQLGASAAEAFLMIPDAVAFQARYADLRMPVVIIAGDQDRLVDIERQSSRLHRQISQSAFRRVRGSGHMVHQTATSDVMAAIDQVTQAAA